LTTSQPHSAALEQITPLFRSLLLGNVSVQVAERASVTTIMVKGRSSRMHSFLRQPVLEPSSAPRR